MSGGWREVRPGYWRRDLPGGSWLGVKPEGGRWAWVLMTPGPARRGASGPDVAAAHCFGLTSAEEARAHADANAIVGPLL